MVYRAIGLMSGSSLDGLDIAFVSFEEIRGQWSYTLQYRKCVPFTDEWKQRLRNAENLTARNFVQLDQDLGKYFGEEVQKFIQENQLEHQTQFIVSHGHTVFHEPSKGVTTQIGAGAHIAAINAINVIDQLRSLDVALGGQGAPIVPLGEQLLFKDYSYFLNIGGITNISIHEPGNLQAFDVCVANQALNYLANLNGQPFDKDGQMASQGTINTEVLTKLNALTYYAQNTPKSLANQYFSTTILPLLEAVQLPVEDLLRTMTEHIAMQVAYSVGGQAKANPSEMTQMLVTGGGAFNKFLIQRLSVALKPYNIEVICPNDDVVLYKEAIIMALLGLLRWREENTVLEITGASRPSIGGAVWIGQNY